MLVNFTDKNMILVLPLQNNRGEPGLEHACQCYEHFFLFSQELSEIDKYSKLTGLEIEIGTF
jgi:hypothetical protein